MLQYRVEVTGEVLQDFLNDCAKEGWAYTRHIRLADGQAEIVFERAAEGNKEMARIRSIKQG